MTNFKIINKPHGKLERPWTRGGDVRGLDFSFIDKNSNQDLFKDESYFDRPVTRSKLRRPVSRQLRLNKRVNNLKCNKGDWESFRGMGDLGKWEPPTLKENMNVHKIQKVIPEIREKADKTSQSPMKTEKWETLLERKRSLCDSTSLDPKLKVNKSISFNRKNSNKNNNGAYQKSDDSQQSTLDWKKYVMGDLNKSIESVVMKGNFLLQIFLTQNRF